MKIGDENWEQVLRDEGKKICPSFWSAFEPVSDAEIEECERILSRTFPNDYRAFLQQIGSGQCPEPYDLRFYSPREIVAGALGPVWMLSEDATAIDDARLLEAYIKRDEGILVWSDSIVRHPFDLVQIGSDGRGCYLQLNCPAHPTASLGFLKVTPEMTYEDAAASFSDGLIDLLHQFRSLNRDLGI